METIKLSPTHAPSLSIWHSFFLSFCLSLSLSLSLSLKHTHTRKRTLSTYTLKSNSHAPSPSFRRNQSVSDLKSLFHCDSIHARLSPVLPKPSLRRNQVEPNEEQKMVLAQKASRHPSDPPRRRRRRRRRRWRRQTMARNPPEVRSESFSWTSFEAAP